MINQWVSQKLYIEIRIERYGKILFEDEVKESFLHSYRGQVPRHGIHIWPLPNSDMQFHMYEEFTNKSPINRMRVPSDVMFFNIFDKDLNHLESFLLDEYNILGISTEADPTFFLTSKNIRLIHPIHITKHG